MKRIHAAGAARIQEGQARRRAYHQTLVVDGDVGDVIRNEPIGACQNLFLSAILGKTHETVCPRHPYRATSAVRDTAVAPETITTLPIHSTPPIPFHHIIAPFE